MELLLVDASPSRAHHDAQQSGSSALQVEGALLLSGVVTSTVLEIGALGGSVEVRAPALPLTVSPTVRFQSVGLSILVRDCNAAIGWATGDRPFTIRWRDEYGKAHLDRAGDFGRSMARSLIRYTDAVCGPRNR